jgi:hypothetical protein
MDRLRHRLVDEALATRRSTDRIFHAADCALCVASASGGPNIITTATTSDERVLRHRLLPFVPRDHDGVALPLVKALSSLQTRTIARA